MRRTVTDIPSVFPSNGQAATLVFCSLLSKQKNFEHHGVCQSGHVNSLVMTQFWRNPIFSNRLSNCYPSVCIFEVDKAWHFSDINAEWGNIAELSKAAQPMFSILGTRHSVTAFHLAEESNPAVPGFCWRLAWITIFIVDSR